MMKPRKWHQVTADYLVPIAGDAMIAGPPVAEGKMVPLAILDTTHCPRVEELIRVHQHLPPGDVDSQWGQPPHSPDALRLFLEFHRPMKIRLLLSFSIEAQAPLIESALTAGALYLQSGRPGDRFLHDMGRPKIIIELPDTGFRPIWDKLFLSRMTAVLSSKLGISRRKAEPRARRLIAELREVTNFRAG